MLLGNLASFLGAALALSASLALAAPPAVGKLESRSMRERVRRATVTDPSALDGQSFDYVIVGGGTAGLVLAGRLSQNSSLSVAVIEAGDDGSGAEDAILAPAQAYFNGIASLQSEYDWHYETSNQTELEDRQIFWPRGKLLGGSSAVNGLYMCRASEIEMNSWATLVNESAWGWENQYLYMKKSEWWQDQTEANKELSNQVTDASLHGTDGPVGYSYPSFVYPQIQYWVPTFANLGIDTRDPAGGETWGAYTAMSALNNSLGASRRSYAKTGYLDNLAAGNDNLVVLTGYQATRIVFDGTTATGVEFAADATSGTYTVNANSEVILSAGVIGSPQLLQVSGVGPAATLEAAGVDVIVDLPGVGAHLMDHLSGELVYSTTAETTGDGVETNTTIADAQFALWQENDPDSLYTAPNNNIAYVNLSTILGGDDAATTFIDELRANMSDYMASYSTDSTIQAGYQATYEREIDDIYPSAVGQVEILMVNTGVYGAYGDGNYIGVQAAIQHPLSRGFLTITSDSTFDAPNIDPGYLTHPADIRILRAGFQYARTVAQTEPLATILGTELNPGTGVQTDDEWDAWIRASVSTEYHPSSSCSMIPQEQGGCVDTSMRVYGTTNLRVVDSSIVPIGMSAHMTAPLYGVAEHAYDVLVNGLQSGDTSGGSAATVSSGTNSATSTSTSAGSSQTPNGSSSGSSSSQDNTTGAAAGMHSGLSSALALLTACVGAVLVA